MFVLLSCFYSNRLFQPGEFGGTARFPLLRGLGAVLRAAKDLVSIGAQSLRCGPQKAAQDLCLHGLPVAGIQAVGDIGVNAQPPGGALDAFQRVSRPADRLLRLLHCVLQVGAGEHLRRGRYDLLEIHSPSAPLPGPTGP